MDDPEGFGSEHGVDLIALARLYEQMGDQHAASRLYLHGLEHQDALSEKMPRATLIHGLHRLAAIHKRKGDWEPAIKLWEQAAHRQDFAAHLELASVMNTQLKIMLLHCDGLRRQSHWGLRTWH